MLRIRFERLKQNWRQQDLAFYANVPVAEVSRIESGRIRPYRRHAERLAAALNITTRELTEEVREQ